MDDKPSHLLYPTFTYLSTASLGSWSMSTFSSNLSDVCPQGAASTNSTTGTCIVTVHTVRCTAIQQHHHNEADLFQAVELLASWKSVGLLSPVLAFSSEHGLCVSVCVCVCVSKRVQLYNCNYMYVK